MDTLRSSRRTPGQGRDNSRPAYQSKLGTFPAFDDSLEPPAMATSSQH